MTKKQWAVSFGFKESKALGCAEAIELIKDFPTYARLRGDDGRKIHCAKCGAKPREFSAFYKVHLYAHKFKSYKIAVNDHVLEKPWHINAAAECYIKSRESKKTDSYCNKTKFASSFSWGCKKISEAYWFHDSPILFKEVLSFFIDDEIKRLDKDRMKRKIDAIALHMRWCPIFNYDRIIMTIDALPDYVTETEYRKLILEIESIYRQRL